MCCTTPANHAPGAGRTLAAATAEQTQPLLVALSHGRMHVDVCLQACCQVMMEKQAVKVKPVVKGLQHLIMAADDGQGNESTHRAATGAWMVLCALQPHDAAAADWEFLDAQWKAAVRQVWLHLSPLLLHVF